ncbi:MAG: FUSC family protein [Paludibacterium sp.]|uniref:FUSC family protein n=1 Tax=Paludibacterium sp. TaxID=1917523 RepID=UPI0025CB9A50|nr:FUSC family protein [Paludibacterium sp.]MBV8049321.1 FUSC family protein [Paludibacterium sp.]MBV8646740.1 FUSC family protein [Paludibacterium sp.]
MSLRRLVSHWLHPRFRYNQLAVIHGLRLAFAYLTAWLIGNITAEPYSVWMIVTVAVVMGSLPHTGSIVEKGKQRFLGTTLGALGGFLVIYLMHLNPLLAALAIVAIVGYSGFWAVRGGGYIAQLTCITLAIVSTNSAFDVGLWRMLDVYAGVVLAIAFGMLFPERARDHWYFMLEESLEGLNWLYRELATRGEYDMTLAEGLRQRHGKMRELIAAVARESGLNGKDLKSTLGLLHRAQVAIEFLASEAAEPVRQAAAGPADEKRVVASLTRIAQRFALPIAEGIPSLSMPPSPQQVWLLSTLARHLEELEAMLDKMLPKLRGQDGSRWFETAWPPQD